MPSHRDSVLLPAITMEDDLGIVYLVENAQQFWSELEDILSLSRHDVPTLEQLDLTLRQFISLCASYHEQYLQSPLQLEHACNLILDSELFAFHSERMSEILTNDAQSNTNPHFQLICYHILLCYGRRRTEYLRSHKRWEPLIPLLMDHVLVDIDSEVEDTYFGVSGGSNGTSVPVPIEAKLRTLAVMLLYEVCRVQKLSMYDLRVFDDTFVDYLFDLIEQTRHMQDDTFNYSVIKLIVALNEQFMVASLGNHSIPDTNELKNCVLRVLMRRLGSSKTFGENMIFMLNRAQRTPEDLCMQLLVLKLLYLLFTTKGTEEYFYTNDLCVLVDVFLRDLVDLDEDSESLRHTYLRVLHPLLTKTQLRSIPYKRPQIMYTLESLVRDSRVRDVNPTTKRLVDRCLTGEWCVQLRQTKQEADDDKGSESSWTGVNVGVSAQGKIKGTRSHLGVPPSKDHDKAGKTLKTSRSMEFSKRGIGGDHEDSSNTVIARPESSFSHQRSPRSPLFDTVRRGSNASNTSSTHSITGVASATIPSAIPSPTQLTSSPTETTHEVRHPKRHGTANSAHVEGTFANRPPSFSPTPAHGESDHHHHYLSKTHQRKTSIETLGDALDSTLIMPSQPQSQMTKVAQARPQRRSAPAPPQKRRKPPAIPVAKGKPAGAGSSSGSGVTITTIKSSASVVSSPLGR